MDDTTRRSFSCRGDRIECLQIANGLTIAQLAEKSGVDMRTLKRVLSGQPAFMKTIREIARTLNATPEALIGDQFE